MDVGAAEGFQGLGAPSLVPDQKLRQKLFVEEHHMLLIDPGSFAPYLETQWDPGAVRDRPVGPLIMEATSAVWRSHLRFMNQSSSDYRINCRYLLYVGSDAFIEIDLLTEWSSNQLI